jgi:tryptophanyl-tRNA synthetase
MGKETVLTGDRPTGRLHLGHFVGSIKNRIKLQDEYKQYIMVADIQALTDNAENPEKVRNNVQEVVLDNIATGVDPSKSTFFIQSEIPEIAELTVFFLNLVTLARLQRNPTVKNEMKEKGFGANVPAGFLVYPISQAADILCVRANLVPVGEDQLPMIEQANEIIEKFNSYYPAQSPVFTKIKALTPPEGARLPGIDGKAKMGKSLGNAIYLSDSPEEVEKKVMQMYTDPSHIHAKDPGKVEGNVVFMYLSVFDKDKEKVEELKNAYQKGGLGDVEIKKRLILALNEFLDPIRDKRANLEKDTDYVYGVLKEGIKEVRKVSEKTLELAKDAMKINYFG